MVVISITITASSDQVVSGIPKTVSITTNVPATIFYTLDGSQPTLFSTIYTGPIFLPYTQFLVTLNVMATDGVNYSPIVTEQYQTDIVDTNARLPHAATDMQALPSTQPTYPFGTPPFQPQQTYLNPALAGITVFDPSLPATPTGFGADGYFTGYTNQLWNIENYQIPYSTTDAEGQTGPSIGTIPAKITIPANPDPAYDGEQTEQFTATFNPRALVIFQDFSKEDPNDPPQINRAHFTMENPERARDGVYYFNNGPDGAPPPSGAFVRSHYNPRTNEITHYYRDSWSNQWIISTAPYVPNGNYDGNLSVMPVAWGGRVIEWCNPAVGRMRKLF
jgi:hypothetical protein